MSHKTALLVIDVQNDVVVNGHNRDGIVATIARLVDRARAEGAPIIWVQHADDELVADTPGWEIVRELEVLSEEPVVHKHHRDAFDGTSLINELASLGVARLVITGAQTDFCVRWTLHGAQSRGYNTVLVSDAHTTEDGGPGMPTAAQLIEHTNRFWRHATSSGGTGSVVSAVDVDFAVK